MPVLHKKTLGRTNLKNSGTKRLKKSIIKDENILKLWINKDMTIQKKLIEKYAKQIIEIDSSL